MARYCADKNSEPILKAAEGWRDRALLREGSVFGEGNLWREEHLHALQTHFVDAPDEGEGTFFEKLKGQLTGTPSEVSQLAAEMLWLMFLCPSNVTPAKKKESIRLVWGWSGRALPADHPFLHDDVLDGVGSAGTSFGVHRWRELAFFVRVLRDFKALSQDEQEALLGDGWKFAEWLGRYPESKVRQLRHMLLYLLFPETFERIFGGGDRRLIVQKFTGLDRLKVRALSPLQIDRELSRIRAEQEQKYPDQKLDFYVPPLREQWHDEGFDEKTASIEREDVLTAIREIDEKGVGEHAESTVYDLIEGARRYPPKLVLSLATKHASGEAFDRSMFAGGIGSRAFNLLRGLGFHIERKDFVSTLLTQFFAQANQAVSLVVKGYPDSYRGLAVRVSFGKGTAAKVPWIAFLGYGQENQNGIYPVFLYYKAEQLLILARGISDTARPAKLWRPKAKQDHRSTVIERFGHEPERYGDSYAYRTYRVPAEIDHDAITKDLDALVAEYHDLMSSGERSGAGGYQAATAAPAHPSQSSRSPNQYRIR